MANVKIKTSVELQEELDNLTKQQADLKRKKRMLASSITKAKEREEREQHIALLLKFEEWAKVNTLTVNGNQVTMWHLFEMESAKNSKKRQNEQNSNVG